MLSMPSMYCISSVVTGTPFPEVIQYSGDIVLYCHVLLTIIEVDRILGIGSFVCVNLTFRQLELVLQLSLVVRNSANSLFPSSGHP